MLQENSPNIRGYPPKSRIFRRTQSNKEKLENYNNNLKVLHPNCRSLTRKRSDLKQLNKTFNDNTIFGFFETWFNDTNKDKLLAIDNDKHKLFRCDRTYESSKKLKGGVEGSSYWVLKN